MQHQKLIRITTVPLSLDKLLDGQLKFMNNFYQVTAISSDQINLKKIGKKENVATFHLEMTRKITPIKDLLAVIKLFFFLKKIKPCIVHTHTPKAGIIGMMAAWLAGVPNRLHTVAGLPLMETSGLKRRLLEGVEKLTYAMATQVYPNSNGLRNIIITNGYCAAAKLKVIGQGSSNGINTDKFSKSAIDEKEIAVLRSKLGLTEAHFVFIFVGRLVADKGINELVAAFKRLSSHGGKFKLLLVGDYEPALDPLRADTLDSISCNKDIISVGFQQDVRPYLALADTFVFPSYREGFPNVVMQAAAMELPCIVSDINGCNEIIESGVNGLIVPVKNTDALLQAMQEIASNLKLFLHLKRNTRERIVKNYAQHAVWEALLAEYRNLVS